MAAADVASGVYTDLSGQPLQPGTVVAHLTRAGTTATGTPVWTLPADFGVQLARINGRSGVDLTIDGAGDVTVNAIGIVNDTVATATDVGVLPGVPDPAGRLPSAAVAPPDPSNTQKQCAHGAWVKARAIYIDGTTSAVNRLEAAWTTWGYDGTCMHSGVTDMQVIVGNKKTYCSGSIAATAKDCKWTHQLTPPYSSGLDDPGHFTWPATCGTSCYQYTMRIGLMTNRDVDYVNYYCEWSGTTQSYEHLQCDANQYT